MATSRQSSAAVTSLVLGSLNSMIDDTTTRLVALENHPPVEIYMALGALVLASLLLAGLLPWPSRDGGIGPIC